MTINFKKSTKQLAIDRINEALNTSFIISDIDVTEIEAASYGGYNTKARIINLPNGRYPIDNIIRYNRTDLEKLFRSVDIRMKPGYQKLISEYLPVFNEMYGYSLTEEDIVDTLIPEGMAPPFVIDFVIREDNPAFIGHVEVLITFEDMVIPNILTQDNALDDEITAALDKEVQKDPKTPGRYFYCNVDWSNIGSYLNGLVEGSKITVDFPIILNKLVDHVWVHNNTVDEFNLYDAKVLYNGPTANAAQYTDKTGFENVLVIELSDVYCSNVGGYLLFHYNNQVVLPI